MDQHRLRGLVQGGEQERVEFKGGVPFDGDFRLHLATTIAAMANTPGGGTIVVGVENTGAIAGLSTSDLETYDPTTLGNFLLTRLSPTPAFRVIKTELDGARLIVIDVHAFDDLPVVVIKALESGKKRWAASGDVLVRTRAAETKRANGEELRALLARVRMDSSNPAVSQRPTTTPRMTSLAAVELPSEQQALAIAQASIAGKVLAAHPYADARSGRIFLSGICRRDRERAFVLESVAAAYRILWESDPLPCPVQQFAVEDIDNDDALEFCFHGGSWGSGAGTAMLVTYSLRRRTAYLLVEEHCWQDRTLPLQPKVTYSPEPDDSLRVGIERLAQDRFDMLRGVSLDWDSSDAASMWWHADNGGPQTGPLTFRRYPGLPRDESSREEYESRGTHWFAFFKGPLVGYMPDANEHFIAYSPPWSYNWVTCMRRIGDVIWFAQHASNGLKALHVSGVSGFVQHVARVGAHTLPEVDSIQLKRGSVILNGDVALPVHDLFAALDRNAYPMWPPLPGAIFPR